MYDGVYDFIEKFFVFERLIDMVYCVIEKCCFILENCQLKCSLKVS